ncbi:MAG: glycosyltransferase family 4 protein, partial [Ignavibacteriae bacterium]|nr:glycosyltransferase family 4 protein [Ignavibacteriota bacterium]
CSGNCVEGIRGDATEFREYVRASDVDVMMNYAAQIWSTDLLFDLLPSLRMKKVLVPCGYSRLHDPLFAEYFRRMPEVLAAYNKAIYLSPDYIDTAFGEQHGLQNGIVIPNGADLREFGAERRGRFRKRFGLGDRPIILNVSNHSTLKGHDFFWRCIRQLKDLNVAPVLIGSAYVPAPKKWLTQCYAQCRFESWRNGALHLEDWPRDGVADAYLDADLFLFGSRVECSPLVMFEAFASKTLFITTDCGNVKDYSNVVCVVNDEDEAIDVVRDYCGNKPAYAERIQRGYDLFLKSLNWEAIAHQYETLYAELIQTPEIAKK